MLLKSRLTNVKTANLFFVLYKIGIANSFTTLWQKMEF